MGNNQFASLGERVDLPERSGKTNDFLYKEHDVVSNISRRLTFVLFDEIVEGSSVQSRKEVFNPDKNPEDKELLESIKAYGIVTPIVVRAIKGLEKKQGNREFGIVAGHRRVAAGRAAGLPGVEGAISREGEDHAVITIIENMGKRSLSSFEKGIALYTLKQERGITIREVAEATGNAKTYVGELMQALQSPGVLREIWEEDEISSKAIVKLKKHWGLFEKEEASPLLKYMHGLSQKQASELNDQLNAGTDLKTALAVIKSIRNGRELDTNKSPGKKPNRASASALPKKELITAIGDVFTGLKESQISTLFDFAEHIGINDPEILWVAALYLDRGGKPNQAVPESAAAMADRSWKSLLNHEVKLMKKVAIEMKAMTKEDKIIREFMQVVFPSRR